MASKSPLPTAVTKKSPRGRPSKKVASLGKLKPLGIFRLRDAKKVGVSQQTLSRLVQEGRIIRLDYDLYRHPESSIDPATEDFAVACAKFSRESAIGGLSALFHYNLTDQAPRQIWVLVPPTVISRNPRYRCMRTKSSLAVGIVEHRTYRITTIERAIAEAFRFATKLGLETAIGAARQATRNKQTTAAKILKMARALGYESHLLKHWEAIIVE